MLKETTEGIMGCSKEGVRVCAICGLGFDNIVAWHYHIDMVHPQNAVQTMKKAAEEESKKRNTPLMRYETLEYIDGKPRWRELG